MSVWKRIKRMFAPPMFRDRVKYVIGPHGVDKSGRLQMEGRSAWDAADFGRLRYINGDEVAATPGEEELRTMRERSTHLERNDSLCFAAIETKVANTVTHKLRPQSLAYGDDPETLPPRYSKSIVPEEAAEVYRNQVEAAWLINAPHIAADGMGFEQFAALAWRTVLSRGEVLVHRVTVEGREFRTAYELIDCGRLSTPHSKINADDVTSGIRFGENGEPVEYFVKKSTSSMGLTDDDYDIFPAADIRHLFKRTRPGQKRGIPDLAVCLQSAKDRKDLADATIIKAQNSASITAIMSTSKPGDLESDLSTDTETIGSDTWEVLPIHKGQLQILPHGDNMYEFKSDYPSATYESFMVGVKADIARGVGISYLSLTRDASSANFSSMKGVLLQDRMTYQADRNYFRRELLDWIWENHCAECLLAGWATAPNFTARKALYTRVAWQFGPYGMIEPVKETEGFITAISANLASKAAVAQSEGEDIEEIIDSNLRTELYEKERRAEMGLELPVEGEEGAEQETADEETEE